MGLFGSIKKVFGGGKKEAAQPKQPEMQAQPEPEPEGPLTNEYGDIIISMAQFNQLVNYYGSGQSMINGFRYATSNGFVSGMNMINNMITINTNNGPRTYDPRVCKALFLDGMQYYVVVDENHLRRQGIDPNFKNNILDFARMQNVGNAGRKKNGGNAGRMQNSGNVGQGINFGNSGCSNGNQVIGSVNYSGMNIGSNQVISSNGANGADGFDEGF